MKRPEDFRHSQKAAVFLAMLLFSLVLLLLQMWLFVATLDNFLQDNYSIAVPAAVLSVACLMVNAWMLVGLTRMEESK